MYKNIEKISLAQQLQLRRVEIRIFTARIPHDTVAKLYSMLRRRLHMSIANVSLDGRQPPVVDIIKYHVWNIHARIVYWQLLEIL